ncbi:UNVERIFIED_CONTAM: hypothetical protein NCL1_45217 [Trichonephila clavipes]
MKMGENNVSLSLINRILNTLKFQPKTEIGHRKAQTLTNRKHTVKQIHFMGHPIHFYLSNRYNRCGHFSEATGGYNFAFRVTRTTFAFPKMDITPGKCSKIVERNEDSSMTFIDRISSRYRKPKGRPSKRRKILSENSKKRWQKSSKTVDEKNSNSMILQRDTLSDLSVSSQPETSYVFTHKTVFSKLLQKAPYKYCTNCARVTKQHHSMGYSTKMEAGVYLLIHRKMTAALETFSSVLNIPTRDRKIFAKCMHNLSLKNKENQKGKVLESNCEEARHIVTQQSKRVEGEKGDSWWA